LPLQTFWLLCYVMYASTSTLYNSLGSTTISKHLRIVYKTFDKYTANATVRRTSVRPTTVVYDR